MRLIQALTKEQFAKPAAQFMKFMCYAAIFFYALNLGMSCMGRQVFVLHTKDGSMERAIYAEENHGSGIQGFYVQMGDDVHVWTNDQNRIDLTVQIGLSAMFAVNTVPMIFAFWFLSRVFSNIRKGQIFTEQNASCLLYFGLLQFSVAVFVPFAKLLIGQIVSLVSDCQMSVSTGQVLLTTLIPSIAYMVAAYIIHYGIHLQDEVDHTL